MVFGFANLERGRYRDAVLSHGSNQVKAVVKRGKVVVE